ncbi:hypothetical protein [Evansella clarkii]|nr:hypothetical protein [Evansella clarkii]
MPYRTEKQYKAIGKPLRGSGIKATYEYTSGNETKEKRRKNENI